MYAKGNGTGEMGLSEPRWFHQEFPVLDIELQSLVFALLVDLVQSFLVSFHTVFFPFRMGVIALSH